jgi:hypothetical protein
LDADELKLLLARAFDRAWGRYYRPGGRDTISPDMARPALATHLVQMAKDGVTDEGDLAAGGVLHLFSITPDDPGDLIA